MANDTIDLQSLVGRRPDADFPRDMIGFAATRLINLKMARSCLIGWSGTSF
jgi:hypothetical protein